MPEPTAFSFDVYPGLDADLDAAFQRNVEAGIADAGEVAAHGLAQAVNTTLAGPNTAPVGPNALLSPEAGAWARAELDRRAGLFTDKGALEKWEKYGIVLGTSPPRTLDQLMDVSPNLGGTVERLHEASKALKASGELTPEGLPIGEHMELTLMPWKAFRDNIDRLPEWLQEVRAVQGKTTQADLINDDLLRVIRENSPLYRDLGTADIFMPIRRYLDIKIAQDGDWGLILTQTSEQAGIESLKVTKADGTSVRQSPDEMTQDGTGHLVIAGQNVDGLGVLEWLAMTMQHDPTKLSGSVDLSWLLANRLDVGGRAHVPAGDFGGGQVKSSLYWADNQSGRVRARLAVI